MMTDSVVDESVLLEAQFLIPLETKSDIIIASSISKEKMTQIMLWVGCGYTLHVAPVDSVAIDVS